MRSPPNKALELTPLCGPRIGAILIVGNTRMPCRSISAAQLSASALGRPVPDAPNQPLAQEQRR